MGFPHWLLRGGGAGSDEKMFHFDRFLPHAHGTDWLESVYVKVNELGKVVETGTTVKGRPGFVHLLGLPWIYESHTLKVALADGLENPAVSVGGILVVTFSDATMRNGSLTNYQELYDAVIKGGFEHLDDYLRRAVLLAGLRCGSVQSAFRDYAGHRQHPTELLRSLSAAIQTPIFGSQLRLAINLSNLASAQLELKLDVTANMSAKFKF